MHGFPSGFEASRFVGRVLEEVAFSANTVHLSFDASVSITIESSFAHWARQDAGLRNVTEVPVTESRLMQLIDASVESAVAADDGTLTLNFSNGQSFECYDDTPMYEAYHIMFGDEEIHV